MSKFLRSAGLAALLCATSLSGANAEDAFYLGQWKIAEAVPGPWIKSDAELFPDEMKSLVGQTLTIKADAIEGPGGFPCKGPKYEVIEGGPDMLFQGAFGQMQSEDAANDPQKLAAREAEYKARFANPFVAGARGYIDDVIQPHETRKRVCRSLAMLRNKAVENPWRKHGNIPL